MENKYGTFEESGQEGDRTVEKCEGQISPDERNDILNSSCKGPMERDLRKKKYKPSNNRVHERARGMGFKHTWNNWPLTGGILPVQEG